MQSKHPPRPLVLGGFSSLVFPHTVAEFGTYQGQLQNSHQAPQCWIRPMGKQTGNQQHRFAWCHWLVGEGPFLLAPGQEISSPASRKTQWENQVSIQKMSCVSDGTMKTIQSFSWSFSMELRKNRLTGGHRALPEFMGYQARRKHPVTVGSAVLEDTSWRKWPDFFSKTHACGLSLFSHAHFIAYMHAHTYISKYTEVTKHCFRENLLLFTLWSYLNMPKGLLPFRITLYICFLKCNCVYEIVKGINEQQTASFTNTYLRSIDNPLSGWLLSKPGQAKAFFIPTIAAVVFFC